MAKYSDFLMAVEQARKMVKPRLLVSTYLEDQDKDAIQSALKRTRIIPHEFYGPSNIFPGNANFYMPVVKMFVPILATGVVIRDDLKVYITVDRNTITQRSGNISVVESASLLSTYLYEKSEVERVSAILGFLEVMTKEQVHKLFDREEMIKVRNKAGEVVPEVAKTVRVPSTVLQVSDSKGESFTYPIDIFIHKGVIDTISDKSGLSGLEIFDAIDSGELLNKLSGSK